SVISGPEPGSARGLASFFYWNAMGAAETVADLGIRNSGRRLHHLENQIERGWRRRWRADAPRRSTSVAGLPASRGWCNRLSAGVTELDRLSRTSTRARATDHSSRLAGDSDANSGSCKPKTGGPWYHPCSAIE